MATYNSTGNYTMLWHQAFSSASYTITGSLGTGSINVMPIRSNFPWDSTSTTNEWSQWYSPLSSSTQLWEQWNIRDARSKRQKMEDALRQRRQREFAALQEEQRRERQRQEAAERVQAAAEAEERARILLEAHLTDEQREMWERERRMIVHSNRGRLFEIRRSGLVANVARLGPNGYPVTRFCAHPVGVPDSDAYLAQKLAIETDEDYFIMRANVHPLHAAGYPLNE